MIMKSKTGETIAVYCDCGCDNGILIKGEKEDFCGEYAISLVSDIYYTSLETCWDRFKEKCKRIWRIIRNKEYCYFSICLSEEDMKEFKDFISVI